MLKEWDEVQSGVAPKSALLDASERRFFETLAIDPTDPSALNGLGSVLTYRARSRCCGVLHPQPRSRRPRSEGWSGTRQPNTTWHSCNGSGDHPVARGFDATGDAARFGNGYRMNGMAVATRSALPSRTREPTHPGRSGSLCHSAYRVSTPRSPSAPPATSTTRRGRVLLRHLQREFAWIYTTGNWPTRAAFHSALID